MSCQPEAAADAELRRTRSVHHQYIGHVCLEDIFASSLVLLLGREHVSEGSQCDCWVVCCGWQEPHVAADVQQRKGRGADEEHVLLLLHSGQRQACAASQPAATLGEGGRLCSFWLRTWVQQASFLILEQEGCLQVCSPGYQGCWCLQPVSPQDSS